MRRPWLISLGLIFVLGLGFGLMWWLREEHDPKLKPFVLGRPAYPIVFTSRSNTQSLRAASTLGEGFHGNGLGQWQAQEGRLRVLTTSGKVRELTWNKPLPDGSTIFDVISPSVSADGQRVVFAGRRQGHDGERFRIYRVNLNGTRLEQLTGGADDPGCNALPPWRYDAQGQRLPDEQRRRLDYDDVDPIELPGGQLIFASSRAPDLGGTFTRRATQIWCIVDGKYRPMSASRANDRWPYALVDGRFTFTLWSHQNEVISADQKELVRLAPGEIGATTPPNNWIAAQISATGEAFGHLTKPREAVWRGRPSFEGRLMFMTPDPSRPTPFTPENEQPENHRLLVASSEPARVTSAPSALARDSQFPQSNAAPLRWLPAQTADGRTWSLATPSPEPDGLVLAAAQLQGQIVPPKAYGLYRVYADAWTDTPSVGQLNLIPLFDDPNFVDAEPVVAYPRTIATAGKQAIEANYPEGQSITLASGERYSGPLHQIENRLLFQAEQQNRSASGQTTNQQQTMLAPPIPVGGITEIVFYATPRDRFDDEKQERLIVPIRKLAMFPVQPDPTGAFMALIPPTDPTMLLGLNAQGRVASVLGAADSAGQRGKFYAFAGDHVSGARPRGHSFCTGCHVGHSHTPAAIAEQRR